jgi:hypothetical protein
MERCAQVSRRTREAIMPGSNHSSKIAKWGMAEKAPPYLPLNVHVGEKAPDFALPSTDGKTVRLSQYLGHNVLLDFYEGYW